MHRFKFEDYQVELIKDSLKANFEGASFTYYIMLCNALGEDANNFEVNEKIHFDSESFLNMKKAAISKHERLRDIYLAKVTLFEAEHKFSENITSEEQAYLMENKGKCSIEETIITDIQMQFEYLAEMKKLIEYFEKKTAPEPPKPHKEPHPLADYNGYNGRLTSPVDTII